MMEDYACDVVAHVSLAASCSSNRIGFPGAECMRVSKRLKLYLFPDGAVVCSCLALERKVYPICLLNSFLMGSSRRHYEVRHRIR
jgi:hypothetical protein